MLIAYVVIFGIEYGSGHLVRAKRFKSNGIEKVEIICIVDNANDQGFLPDGNTTIIEANQFPFFEFNNYDLIIFDELGLFFDKANIKNIPFFAIDPIYSKKNEIEKFYNLNYNTGYIQLPNDFKNILLTDERKILGLVQGGGDDHNTISKIVKCIPLEYYIVIAVNKNCRHIADLRDIALGNKRVTILVDFPLVKLLAGMDCIITAGGNILFELLSSVKEQKIILYSKESKEHKTFDLFLNDFRIKKRFEWGEEFYWSNDFFADVALNQKSDFLYKYLSQYK